ncbi:hypothetical protein ACFT2C_22935 [Promicromonospora sp. NPDC057138]|uniref:hypothetical protein n=1 Tax=Promicromonospora sp. NPDC057138 TaxID=3346031 RepID=UPI003638C36E
MAVLEQPGREAGQEQPVPAAVYEEALEPLTAWGQDTFDLAVGYVRDGTTPEVLTALTETQTVDLRSLTHRQHRTDAGLLALATVCATALAATIARLGRVLAAATAEPTPAGAVPVGSGSAGSLPAGPARAADGVPDWLGPLTNMVANTEYLRYRDVDARNVTVLRERWTPHFLREVARAGGVPEGECVAVVLRAVLQRDAASVAWIQHRRAELSATDAMDAFLAEHADALPGVVRGLTASGKQVFLEAAKRDLAVHGEMVASLAVDPTKGVRAEARRVLATLPDADAVRLLAPLMTTAAPSRLGEVVRRLAALRDAERDAERDVALELPPYEPPREFALGAGFVAEARSLPDAPSDEDLRAVVTLMNGDLTDGGKRVRRLVGDRFLAGSWLKFHLAELPPTAPVHRLRLSTALSGGGLGRWEWLMWLEETATEHGDLRAAHDVLAQDGTADPEKIIGDAMFQYTIDASRLVDKVWPYFAERVDLLVPHLAPRERDYESMYAFERALAILGEFPALPAAARGPLGEVALTGGKKARLAAQEALQPRRSA